MAKASKEISRDLQSDLHDLADGYGERIARNELVELTYSGPKGPGTPSLPVEETCICKRYSETITNKKGTFVHFRNEQDANCKYHHLQPLASPFWIKLP